MWNISFMKPSPLKCQYAFLTAQYAYNQLGSKDKENAQANQVGKMSPSITETPI